MSRSHLKVWSTFVLLALWFSGCAGPSPHGSIPISGGQAIKLERQGEGFKHAENDRIAIVDAGLQTVNLDGNYYVRWTLSVRPKQATELSTIRIEDVTGSTPLLLVNDVAPQLEAGRWTENAGLMEFSSTGARWLFDPGETARVFRLTFSEPDGRSYVLYQGIAYSPAAKEAFRRLAGR